MRVPTFLSVLILSSAAFGQSTIDQTTGKGQVSAQEIAQAFNWDAATYAAIAGNLTFDLHTSIPFTTTVQIVPPSGVPNPPAAGPEVARIATQPLAGSAGAGGATFSGFSGTQTIQFAEPTVGQPYNPFGKGFSGSYLTVTPGGMAKPSVTVTATLTVGGKIKEAHLVFSKY